ncbi:LysR family transcriptional regulator [Saccharopolyspora erythraea NRRL 2338]|uniref:LysR-family transcriptional regulator n=2 Tax=Saccharopolyspora erythraea TaxID=1836 RepID=A4FP71_SACEN|nr:LysR family transcriptional regulator [Saccharopolyspora erythraea]EQD84772.1 LysR family transcriptional regulator [Saccharopolyspora erythraea D]PFG99488.1 LysR family transcriptional regulator [Saccharopolyspora erythraea NRRL 2338]QRK89392.1 LysR family transcriptional regulator [Saccharopolyspora erythraea]CAM05846.1 LysR-family transcriptional regulator [Saccharopolyspora erythraea NRRL 2338]
MDLNLLLALDVLLEEQSVTRAAERLRTSPAAMSRTLARIRRVLDDPVLVRAGQSMVMTPRAVELRDEVKAVVSRSRALLTLGKPLDPASLSRSFTLQTSDMLGAALTPVLLARVGAEAPEVTLRFAAEAAEGTPALREGRVDVEIGVIEHVDPETRSEALTSARLVAAVRPGHPLIRGRVTPDRFSAAAHISVSRRGRAWGPIDERLDAIGLRRRVAVVLPSHTAAMFLARDTDLVCLTPAISGNGTAEALGLHTFEVPLELPPVEVGMAWHPRNDADPAHRWLRDHIREAVTSLRLL